MAMAKMAMTGGTPSSQAARRAGQHDRGRALVLDDWAISCTGLCSVPV